MKKFVLFSTLILSLILSSFTAYGAAPIANAVTTDIVASIDGAPIPCYNLFGKVCIFAEDLEDYGFDVSYDNNEKKLYINRYQEINKPITATYVPPQNRPIGRLAYKVYPSNLVTTVDGNKMSSFRADGKTLIYFKALEPYGDVVWNGETRTVTYTSIAPWKYTLLDSGKDTTADISDFSLTLTKNAAGGFDVAEKNMQYMTAPTLTGGNTPNVAFEISFVEAFTGSTTAAVENFLYDTLNANLGEWITNDTTRINEHMKVTINGEPVPVTWVSRLIGNGHSDYKFIFAKKVKTLDDLQSISITFQA
ncbi:hypothetical protein [Anaerotignum sp.]|uniref:hypothetical protein n=1 Tax=Anaerotignum sp. TaxID=2039241 RepID=UPI0027B8FACD|nr:hypothetical protein [Anaerotignum sp.]MCI6057380.1 hypothetical protein [Clostridia bacterium]MDY3596517.1 hypothetical protein [Anaerotignum sp.]